MSASEPTARSRAARFPARETAVMPRNGLARIPGRAAATNQRPAGGRPPIRPGDYVLAWAVPWLVLSLSRGGRIAVCGPPYWRDQGISHMRFPTGWLMGHQHPWLGEPDSCGELVWSAA